MLRADYNRWLNQSVWTDGDTKEVRGDVIPEFAESLTQWMLEKGYQMDERWYTSKARIVATWLYQIHVREVARRSVDTPIQYPRIQHRNTQEDFDQFHHVISSEDFSNFMEAWGLHEDFDLDLPAGQRTLLELPILLWRFVDLESSEQGQLIARYWDNSDSDDERFTSRNRGTDVYLEEAREGFHGGRGSKV